jgi:hypothetical protein
LYPFTGNLEAYLNAGGMKFIVDSYEMFIEINNILGDTIFWKHPICSASFTGMCQSVMISKPTKYQFRIKLIQDTQEQILAV